MQHRPSEAPIEDLLAHTGWVRALAGALARDPNDADELAQETWLKALRRPPRLGIPIKAWLGRVVQNTAKNARRADSRRAQHERSVQTERTAPSASVADSLERADLQADIIQAVQELAPDSRAVVALRYFEDLPPREIATRLSIDIEAVNKRLQRARTTLRSRLSSRRGRRWRAECLAFANLKGAETTTVVTTLAMTNKQSLAIAALVLISCGSIGAWIWGPLGAQSKQPSVSTIAGSEVRTEHADRRDAGDARNPHDRTSVGATGDLDSADRQRRADEGEASTLQLYADRLTRLNQLAKAWFAARFSQSAAAGPSERERLGAIEDAARSEFDTEWDALSASFDLLSHPRALERVYQTVLPYAAVEETPQLGPRPLRTDSYLAWVPRKYDHERPYPTVLYVPDRRLESAKPGRVEKPALLDWGREKGRVMLVVPRIDDNLDLDADLAGQRQIIARNAALLRPMGEFQRQYHVDRNRLILDCGRGSSRFGLRIATMFPTRFAAVILRWPVHDESLRLDSLHGVPILLVRSPETARDCDAIKAKLESISPDSCTILRAGRAGRLSSSRRRELTKWAVAQRRTLMKPTVVIAPNDPSFRRAFWVHLGSIGSVAGAADSLPYFRAVADRVANRITIESRSVESFRLLLNDDLVDLGREITITINGIEQRRSPTRRRSSIDQLIEAQFDANYLFSAQLQLNGW